MGGLRNLLGTQSALVSLVLAFSNSRNQVPLNRSLLVVTLASLVSYVDGAKERVHTAICDGVPLCAPCVAVNSTASCSKSI